jgi:hypothetical protein
MQEREPCIFLRGHAYARASDCTHQHHVLRSSTKVGREVVDGDVYTSDTVFHILETWNLFQAVRQHIYSKNDSFIMVN